MTLKRHEIPTHLNVEDKAFYGLSIRQVMMIMVGLSSAYSLWNQAVAFPPVLRLGLATACGLAAVTLTVVRPGGRGLEEWIFVALRYAALPKVCLWRACSPEPIGPLGTIAAWEELDLHLSWMAGSTVSPGGRASRAAGQDRVP